MAEKCATCDVSASPYCLRCSSKLALDTIVRLSREVDALTWQLEFLLQCNLKRPPESLAGGLFRLAKGTT
jgi:hypothetical protein